MGREGEGGKKNEMGGMRRNGGRSAGGGRENKGVERLDMNIKELCLGTICWGARPD